MNTTLTLDALAAVKEKQQATWASGDYAVIGSSLQVIGERLCDAVDVSAGWKVLDVAAGNGNAALGAARRGCDVTAIDYVEALLDRARQRADADGLSLATRVADAEDLPFDDGSFDAALSTVGVMFAPDPERAAGELLRVVRRSGRIGLAN
jgi:ubiquinone/menaquinone biosynthesis C-methylase UbiE